MSIAELSIAFAGLFIAGVIKGASGIGYSTAALPFLVLAVGLKAAMALVVAPAIVSNLAVMVGTGGLVAVARRFSPFYVASVPGIVIGTGLLATFDAALSTRVLAFLTIAYVGLALAKPELRLPARFERPLAGPAGLVNGVLTGLTGSQIMPLMPYMMSLGLKPAEQVQAINLSVAIASAVLALALLHSGLVTYDMLAASLVGIVPAAAGVAIGIKARARVPESTFKLMSLTVLSLIAMSLLIREPPPSRAECAGPASATGRITP